MSTSTANLRAENDGWDAPEVGRWAEDKYRLISLYDELFASGMKYKWDQRVYIDLYSAAGLSKIKGTDIYLKGSPLLALGVSTLFDKYIFCEEDPKLLDALKKRTAAAAPSADVTFIPGCCDTEIEKLCSAIPKYSSTNRVLSLCLVDPFDFGIKFDTIRGLSRGYVDFLVLLAVGMDAGRNYDHYVRGHNQKIDEALGNTEWRERWETWPGGRKRFREFLATEFATSMQSLNYLEAKVDRMKLVRSGEKNLPLYYIALFSRNPRAHEFWNQVLKYGTDQTSLWY